MHRCTNLKATLTFHPQILTSECDGALNHMDCTNINTLCECNAPALIHSMCKDLLKSDTHLKGHMGWCIYLHNQRRLRI